MPELDIHHESEQAIDPAGQWAGVLAALPAVALAIVSIASHRTHMEAIMQKSSANDAWVHYQSSCGEASQPGAGRALSAHLVGALGVRGEATE